MSGPGYACRTGPCGGSITLSKGAFSVSWAKSRTPWPRGWSTAAGEDAALSEGCFGKG